jgi:hypothetical protein
MGWINKGCHHLFYFTWKKKIFSFFE